MWARRSAVGGALTVFAEEAERPRRGAKLGGWRRVLLPGVGRAEPSSLVAAVRKSPSVHVVGGCAGRGLLLSVIGGEAKRLAGAGGVGVGSAAAGAAGLGVFGTALAQAKSMVSWAWFASSWVSWPLRSCWRPRGLCGLVQHPSWGKLPESWLARWREKAVLHGFRCHRRAALTGHSKRPNCLH